MDEVKDRFQKLYTISNCEGKVMEDCMETIGGELAWNGTFIRHSIDYCIDSLALLLVRLNEVVYH